MQEMLIKERDSCCSQIPKLSRQSEGEQNIEYVD